METQFAPALENQFTDIIGLRSSGIFPKDKEPSVATHIRTRLKVPARG